jgi:hypothetical protein
MGGCVGVAGEVDDPVEEVASEVPPGQARPWGGAGGAAAPGPQT